MTLTEAMNIRHADPCLNAHVGNKSFTAVDKNVAKEGAKIILLLRLSPLVPFNLLNYGLGRAQG